LTNRSRQSQAMELNTKAARENDSVDLLPVCSRPPRSDLRIFGHPIFFKHPHQIVDTNCIHRALRNSNFITLTMAEPLSATSNPGLAIPASKISELKSLIDSHLRSQNVYGQIRDFVRQTTKETLGSGVTADERNHVVMNALREKGVIEEIIKSIRRPNNLAGNGSVVSGAERSTGLEGHRQLANATPVPSPFRRFLHLKINGGRAFVEHLVTNTSGTASDTKSCFVLFIHFRNQRFRTRAVPVAVEPAFDESILLDLQEPEDKSLIDLADLVKLDSKIHVVLARMTTTSDANENSGTNESEVELVASYDIEWRHILGSGGMSIPAELLGAGSQAKIKVPVGVLDMRVEVAPVPEIRVPAADIARALNDSSSRKQELQRQFFQYSRIWWKEYIDISPTFKNRLVKIFAEDEWGGHKPVCYFVKPLLAGRAIDSPRHAARFVSLIPYTKIEAIGAGAGRAEIWHTFHTFLSMRKGDCEDHAVLLCSMLLGFGLDAYVCIGTVIDSNNVERDHLWVLTRSPGRGKTARRVVFWESLTGQRYPHRAFEANIGAAGKDDSLGNTKMPKYGSIGCCFNHTSFFGNTQTSDAVANCQFAFEDGNAWKSMDPEILLGIEHQEQVPLCPSTINHLPTEEALERALRPMISSFRRENLKLGTSWDEQLSYLLTPALSAYEMERLAGVPFGNEEFQQSIKRNVPEGHTFRGYPIVVNQRSPTRVMESFRRAQIATDILGSRGDQVHFALRVRIFTYPEDVCAVWVMLAVKFRPTGAGQ
jgi:centrosomal protein CEP76